MLVAPGIPVYCSLIHSPAAVPDKDGGPPTAAGREEVRQDTVCKAQDPEWTLWDSEYKETKRRRFKSNATGHYWIEQVRVLAVRSCSNSKLLTPLVFDFVPTGHVL